MGQIPDDIWLLILNKLQQPWRLFLSCKSLASLASKVKIPLQICARAPKKEELIEWLLKSEDNVKLMTEQCYKAYSFKGGLWDEEIRKTNCLAFETLGNSHILINCYTDRWTPTLPHIKIHNLAISGSSSSEFLLDINCLPFYKAIVTSRPCFKYDINDLLASETSSQLDYMRFKRRELNYISDVIHELPDSSLKDKLQQKYHDILNAPTPLHVFHFEAEERLDLVRLNRKPVTNHYPAEIDLVRLTRKPIANHDPLEVNLIHKFIFIVLGLLFSYLLF